MKRTALLSVYDKTGIVEFGRELINLGFNIIASGGTARALTQAGIEVTDVATIVGEPILGHRVVTLSRQIHAALLAQDNAQDNAELEKIGIPRIDLVYVNMYPLETEVAKEGHTLQSVIEQTDIGGPTMLRSAAKGRRIVMCHPAQIPFVLKTIRERNFMDGGKMKESFISKLVSEVERIVGSYCLCSADFHLSAARNLECVEEE
jgi:phosphoribosylaminoimidazolecarboxamide formyltransferase/IMP cyclohydrolase